MRDAAFEMASDARPARRILSDRLRGMRFMKQKEEKDLRDKLCAEQKAREQAVRWTVKGKDDAAEERGPIVITEDGMGDNPMQGRLGRRSFGKFAKSGGGGGEKGEGGQVKEEGTTEMAEGGERRRKDRKEAFRGLLKGGVVKKESRMTQLRKNLKNFKNKGLRSGES